MLVKPKSNRKSVKYKNNEIKGAQQGKIKSHVDYKHGKPRYILRTWMENAKRQNEETTLNDEVTELIPVFISELLSGFKYSKKMNIVTSIAKMKLGSMLK